MALTNGEVHYKEIRKLSVANTPPPSSLYKGFPIFGLFKVVDAKNANPNEPEGAGWTRLNTKEYWAPHGVRYYAVQEYFEGDEFTLQAYKKRNTGPNETDPSGVTPSGLAYWLAPSKPSHNTSAVGTSKLFVADTYKATGQYVSWEDIKSTSSGTGECPYLSTNIQVWVKTVNTTAGGQNSAQSGKTYWYHPISQTFYLISTKARYLVGGVGNTESASLREGKILFLIAEGNTRPQAIALVDAKPDSEPASDKSPAAGGANGPGRNNGVNKNGSTSEQSAVQKASIKATVRVRGNFGFVAPGEPEGGEPQMVQYYKSGTSQLQTTSRHYFTPKPNQINYQNLGSEWTEIERVGRIPLVDWKNYKLMKVSFEFLVIPDNTYRTGAFGGTADDGITLSIDEKLENLRNMAARPYPVILYGFDDLLINANPFSMSTGAGVQFVIQELTISSLMRTATGAINRATCSVTLQEVPIEYINIISLPKLVPGQIITPPPTINPPEYGSNPLFTSVIAPK